MACHAPLSNALGSLVLLPRLVVPQPPPNIFTLPWCRPSIDPPRREEGRMSYFRTAILLALLTALFMGVGFLIGGQSGMIVALVIAGAMNLLAYWNSDKMVLATYGAREADEHSAPELYHLVRQLAQAAQLPMPRVFIVENP